MNGDLQRALSEERQKREALEVKVDELIASGSRREGKGKETAQDLVGSDDTEFTPEQMKFIRGSFNSQSKEWMAGVDKATEKFEKRAREAARVSASDSLQSILKDPKGVGVLLKGVMFDVVEDYYRRRLDALLVEEQDLHPQNHHNPYKLPALTLEEFQEQRRIEIGQYNLWSAQQLQLQQVPPGQLQDYESQKIFAIATGQPTPLLPPHQRQLSNQAHASTSASSSYAPRTPVHPSTLPPPTPMHPSTAPPRTPMHRTNSPPDTKTTTHLSTADHARELGMTEDMLRKYRTYFVDASSIETFVKTLLSPLKNRMTSLEKRTNEITSEEAADDAGARVKRIRTSSSNTEGEGMEVVAASAVRRDSSSNDAGGVTREEMKRMLVVSENRIKAKVEADLVEMPLMKQRLEQAFDKIRVLDGMVSIGSFSPSWKVLLS